MAPSQSLLAAVAVAMSLASTAASVCTGTCTTTSGTESCTFTAKMNIYASQTGYYEFEECSGTMPTLGLKQGVTYTFDQSDSTNWFHPLGFAYYADGAHKGVDELEPGISMTSTDDCADTNTCQAPMYYLDDAFLGTTYDNTADTPVGGDDFGLDAYEPKFFYPSGDWADLGSFSVKLTLTDLVYENDLFYFCHIHNNMSGRIKILDSTGSELQTSNTPDLGYAYETQSTFDESCGTWGLSSYQDGDGMCDETFVCGDGSSTTEAFGDCLKAMDCHMNEHMRVTLSSNSAAETFMHQMIPHHQNAVNMAKALLKDGTVTSACSAGDDDSSDCAIESMLWDIINNQNYQINTMQGWLSDNGYGMDAWCDDDGTSADDDDEDDSTSTTLLIVGVICLVLGLILAMWGAMQAKNAAAYRAAAVPKDEAGL